MKRFVIVGIVGFAIMGILRTDLLLAREPSAKKSVSGDSTRALRADSEHNVVKEEGRTVIYKKRNVVDFDGSLIEGEVRNPNEFYFVHRPEEKFGTLVKKRPDFHKEMLRDTVMIR